MCNVTKRTENTASWSFVLHVVVRVLSKSLLYCTSHLTCPALYKPHSPRFFTFDVKWGPGIIWWTRNKDSEKKFISFINIPFSAIVIFVFNFILICYNKFGSEEQFSNALFALFQCLLWSLLSSTRSDAGSQLQAAGEIRFCNGFLFRCAKTILSSREKYFHKCLSFFIQKVRQKRV